MIWCLKLCLMSSYMVPDSHRSPLRHRIENKQKGTGVGIFDVCVAKCPITHGHCAGSSQSIAFSGQ